MNVQIMGILNVTPDSFSDGGKHLDPAAAIERALWMVQEGAAIIDMGAESTRPGAKPVPADIQLTRLIPVLRSFKKVSRAKVSIDTQSAEVAAACLDEGADIINDVSALRADPQMLSLMAKARCSVVLMHMKGTPRTMQKRPRYSNVTREVIQFLKERVITCERAGIARKKIVIDPGFGFGKTFENNLKLFAELEEFKKLKCQLLVGVSRKSFLGRIADEPIAEKRSAISALAGVLAAQRGTAILRVHDVAEQHQALRAWKALSF